MKEKIIQWAVNTTWLIVLITLITLVIHKNQLSKHLEYTHIRSIELIEKGISLGISDQIEKEIHAYRTTRINDSEALLRLNGKLTILIEKTLDQKYSGTNTVTADQVYDRQY